MQGSRRHKGWRPGPEDYIRVFRDQNPWHVTGEVPREWAHEIERPMGRWLWKRLLDDEPHRYQLVLGPRRVGKTTCLYQTVRSLMRQSVPPRKLWWLRLDHPLLVGQPLGVLVRQVLKTADATPDQPAYLFLDELTYAEGWDRWLKTFYDEHWPLRIAASSSSTAALRSRRVESGVGRWEEQYLAPYLFTDFLDLVDQRPEVASRATLDETIKSCLDAPIDTTKLDTWRELYALIGGFPELLLARDVRQAERAQDLQKAMLRSQRLLRSEAVERAVYKDIPQVFGVHNPMKLERMLYALAGQISGVLSPSKLCSDIDLAQPTFDNYLAYFQQAFLVFALTNYAGSEQSKQRRGRKLYFVDGAVRNAALQRGLAPLNDPTEMGLLLENLVASHMHALAHQTQVRLHYWRRKHSEVDLLYDHPKDPLAIEVASSFDHSREGFARLVEKFPRYKGQCYLVAPNAPPALPGNTIDGVGSIPLNMLLLAIGSRAEAQLAQRLQAD